MIGTFICRGYFSKAVETVLVTNSQNQSSKYIEMVIRSEINGKTDDLFYEEASVNGITYARFDTEKANLLLGNVLNRLRKFATTFNEDCRFSVDIPVSYLILASSYFLSDITIPVTCSEINTYQATLETSIEEYGINSSLISLFLNIEVSFVVMIPFIKKAITNQISIPLALEVIHGTVPNILLRSE